MLTLLRRSWLNLKRDYVALALTFALPIVFFTIFASIFARMGGSGDGDGAGPASLNIIVVDEDKTDISRRFVEAIDEQDALSVFTAPATSSESAEAPQPQTYDRASARQEVRGGDYPVAVIIPAGFSEHFGDFAAAENQAAVTVIYDAANPMAQHTVAGLLQAAAMTAAPDILMERGMAQLGAFGGGLTEAQQAAIERIRPYLRGDRPWEELDVTDGDGGAAAPVDEAAPRETASDDAAATGFQGMVRVVAEAAQTDETKSTSGDEESLNMVAYYAAGIGVMFLLFSMAGAAGSILEEEESGTLERVLTANVSMGKLLIANWLFFAALGVVQVALMFTWGAAVFGLDLFTPKHLAGFTVMTLFTAAAAAAFGLILAALCRSRAQLGGLSTIVILIMSALGGSMVPKFVAGDFFNLTSRFTFNGWALDGYLKVFWYDDPSAGMLASLASLWPQLAVLGAMTVVFLFAARIFARRWETA